MFFMWITLNDMKTVLLFCLYIFHMLLYHAAIIKKQIHEGWLNSVYIQNPFFECLVCLLIPI